MSSRQATVSRIMNRDLVTTRTDAQLAPVVEMMMRRGLGEIPVVDHDHALLGFVTRVKLLEPVQTGDSVEEFLGHQQIKCGVTCELDHGFHLDVESSVRVGDVMSRDVVAVKPDTTVKEAAHLMAENHLSILPVVSAFGALLGTVSAVDLLQLFH